MKLKIYSLKKAKYLNKTLALKATHVNVMRMNDLSIKSTDKIDPTPYKAAPVSKAAVPPPNPANIPLLVLFDFP